MRAHGALFASIFGVTLVISALGVGIGGYLSSTAITGVRDGLAAATGTAGADRIEVRRTADPDAQDTAVRSVLAGAYTAPVLVERSVQGSVGDYVVASMPSLDARATLVDGQWPAGADEASMQADAAASVGLVPGDTIELADGVDVMLSATWRATDPLDPTWFGETIVDTGESADGIGPIVVDESLWDEFDASPFARWTVMPDTTAITAAGLDNLATAATGLQDLLKANPDVGSTGIIIDGGLGATALEVDGAVQAVSGVSPVALLLVAAIGIVSLSELGRLLVGVRTGETALLRSRGAAAVWVAWTTAVEILVVAVPAALVGAGLGTAIVLATTGRVPDAASAVTAPAAVVVLAVALATFSAATSAGRTFRRDTANDSGRAQRIAGIGLVAVIVAAAAFAVWQFRLYGSPLIRSTSGSLSIDPVAVLAAPLTLLAVAVIALALFPAIATIGERIAARSTGLRSIMPAWQLSRRVTVFATPVLIVALATGGATVAAAYSASWSTATSSTQAVRTGADVRVVLPSSETLSPTDALDLPGVTAVLPALATTVESGEDDLDLIATGSSASDGIALPDGTTAISMSSSLSPARATGSVSVWLLSDAGAAVRVPVSSGSADVPAGTWSLVAVDLRIESPGSTKSPALVSFEARDIAAETPDGSVELEFATAWEAQTAVPLDGEVLDSSSDAGLAAEASVTQSSPGTIRFMPAGDAEPVAVTITSTFATRAGLAVGDPLSLGFAGSGRTVSTTVSAIDASVPGMSGDWAASADLGALAIQQLRQATTVPDAAELWIRSNDPSATAAALRASLGSAARITTTAQGDAGVLLGSARVALWWGAIGAILLAIVSVSAVAGALLRSRSAEVIVLRAIGVRAREQAAGRRRELGILLAFAAVAGIVGGAIVSILTVGGLARSTVLDPIAGLATPVIIDLVGLAAALAVLAIGLVGVVLVYSTRVGRQATQLSAREEVR
jgi:hypothetical protein